MQQLSSFEKKREKDETMLNKLFYDNLGGIFCLII